MKYIKQCPDCGKKIRFPLDRGRIRVFCSCGYNTIIDPDDTTLYESGSFDLKSENSQSSIVGSINSLLSGLFKNLSWKKFINNILEVKYRIQNIRHLPDSERNKIITAVVLVILLIISAVYFI